MSDNVAGLWQHMSPIVAGCFALHIAASTDTPTREMPESCSAHSAEAHIFSAIRSFERKEP